MTLVNARLHVLSYALFALCALPACGGGGGASSVIPSVPQNVGSQSSGSTSTPSPSPLPSGATPKPTTSPKASSSPGSTPTPTPTPTSIPTPTPTPTNTATPTVPANVPSHIPTWAYDEYNAGGSSASSAQVRQYLSYAEGGLGNAKAVSDCSGSNACSSVWYFDPNKIYDSSVCPDAEYTSFISAAAESWYVHESGYSDFAHRVQGTYSVSCSSGSQNEPVYIANNANASAESNFESYLQSKGDSWNYYMMDDTSGTVVDQMYGSSGGFCGGKTCTTTQELSTNAAVVQSHADMANALNHVNGSPMQFFYNGLSFDGAQTPNDINILQSTSRFVGAICENCVVSANTLKPQMYAPVLNAMAAIDNSTNGSLVLLSTGNSAAGSSSQIAQRLVTTAIIWLGYKDGHTVVWPDLEDTSASLAAWPEDQIYPSQPLESMSGGASDIQVASGVYRREFAACYNNSVSIGRCAAIINANGSSVTVQSSWLQKTYGHSIQLVGGDVISGGSLALQATTFTANSTTIGGGQALLLVP